MLIQEAPFEEFFFAGRKYYVKRDDLLHPLLSGNKYWKLYGLLQVPSLRYKHLVSYGGTQSNAMLSMAALCQYKGWQFHYTSKPLSAHLRQQPVGNLKLALDLGMQLHEVSYDEYHLCVQHLRACKDADSIFVPQGGADSIAQQGINQLADEIKQWQQQRHIERLNVVIPSGTGTMAYYLAKALPSSKVITTALVGNKAYLVKQMRDMLGDLPKNLCILEADRKYHFAKPYAEFLVMYQRLKDAGMVFDLIYAPLMWQLLLQHAQCIRGEVLYLHSGGLMGNEAMLERYKYQGMF